MTQGKNIFTFTKNLPLFHYFTTENSKSIYIPCHASETIAQPSSISSPDTATPCRASPTIETPLKLPGRNPLPSLLQPLRRRAEPLRPSCLQTCNKSDATLSLHVGFSGTAETSWCTCVVSYIHDMMSTLSKNNSVEKLAEIDLIGFGFLRLVPNWSVKQAIMVHLAESYQVKPRTFILDIGNICLNTELIEKVFGIPSRVCIDRHWWMYAFEIAQKRLWVLDSMNTEVPNNERLKVHAYAGRLIEDMAKVSMLAYEHTENGLPCFYASVPQQDNGSVKYTPNNILNSTSLDNDIMVGGLSFHVGDFLKLRVTMNRKPLSGWCL
ncbi:hypothetical protein AHAS_Ahas15G0280500 [Arachis hypogaea]